MWTDSEALKHGPSKLNQPARCDLHRRKGPWMRPLSRRLGLLRLQNSSARAPDAAVVIASSLSNSVESLLVVAMVAVCLCPVAGRMTEFEAEATVCEGVSLSDGRAPAVGETAAEEQVGRGARAILGTPSTGYRPWRI